MKDVPTTNLNITEFVLIHAQSELFLPMDIVPEDAIQTVTSWITNVMLNAQLDSVTELMLLVLLNAQSVILLMEQYVNLFHKTAHQDNSIMLKLVFALLAHILVLNVNMLQIIVQHVHQDSPLHLTNVLKPTAVELVSLELHQDHAQLVHKNVLIVSVPQNVLLVLQDTFTTELTAS